MTTLIQQNPPIQSKLSALWALFSLTLRQYRHGKRWMVMAAMMLLPVGMAILMRIVAPNVPSIALEFAAGYFIIPQALLPLVALIYASGMIQDEQEEQTITYLLVRPIPKWALYAMKLLATLVTTVALSVVFTACTYIAVYAGTGADAHAVISRCFHTAAIHSLAVIAYCCLFGLISLFTKRILVVGILYIVIFEGLFANLAFGIRLITVIYYARIIAYRTLPFIDTALPLGSQDLAAAGWQLDLVNDPNLLEHPQVHTCIAVLLIASLVCAAVAAWICSRREFYVKTPEKA